MVIHVDIRHICRLVPFWLSRHIIRNHLAVDGDVPATAMIVLTGTVDGRTVVAGTCKEMLLIHVVAGKDVEAVAPTIPAHHLGILHGYGIAATDWQLGSERTVDIDV